MAALAPVPSLAQQRERDLADKAISVGLRSAEEKSGDDDALAARWLNLLSQIGSDFRAELLAIRLNKIGPLLSDPETHIAPATRLFEDPRLRGWTRDLVGNFLLNLYRRVGDTKKATVLVKESGYLLDWWAIGPFGKGQRSTLTASFPPEKELNLTANYRDGWQRLKWQRFVTHGDNSTIFAPFRLFPSSGWFYCMTQVNVKRATPALLERHSSSDLRVWLNGKLVADDDLSGQFLESPRSRQLHLGPGWNRILVKTRDVYRLRLTDLNGNPFELDSIEPAVFEDTTPTDLPEVASSTLAAGDELTGSLGQWQAWIDELKKHTRGAESVSRTEAVERLSDAYISLALVSIERRRDDLAVEAADAALELQPDDAFTNYHVGRVYRQASYLPNSVSTNRSQDAFAKAVQIEPQLLPAYDPLAEQLELDEKPNEAVAKIQEALSQTPGFLRGLRRLKSIYESVKWTNEAALVVDEIERYAPKDADAPLFRAEHYAELGNLDAAAREYQQAFKRDQSRVELLGKLADLEVDRGNHSAAEAYLREWIARVPDAPSPTRRLVKLLVDIGRPEDAIAPAEALRRVDPQSPRGEERLANVFDAARQQGKALTHYTRAAKLDPGSLRLKRYVRSLHGSSDRFWEPYDERLEEWIDEIPNSGRLVEKAAAVVVLDLTVVRMEPDGSTSQYTHQATKLLSAEAKDDIANVGTPGEVVLLRTLSADGSVLEPVPATGQEAYVMPGVNPGAIVEHAHRTDRSARHGRPLRLPRFFFMDPTYQHSFLLSRYVVLLPREAPADVVETALNDKRSGSSDWDFPNVTKTVRDLEDGGQALIYEARNVPRIQRERLQPSPAEYVPNVEVISKRSWTDLANELVVREKGLTRATSELKRLANEWLDGITTPLDKARTLYTRVNKTVPTSRGGSTAVQVALEKAGDRTVLFKALLDLAGVKNHWAYLRPVEASLPRRNWAYPTARMFPYRVVAIVREEDSPLFVSLRNRSLPFGLLPAALRGGKAMILTRNDAEMKKLPGLRPELLSNSLDLTLRPTAGLAGEVKLHLVSRRAQAYAQKERFKTIQEFQKRLVLQSITNRFYPGASVKGGDFVGLDDVDTPFTIAVELTTPKLLQEDDRGTLIKPIPQPLRLVRSFGGKSQRTHPFHLTNHLLTSDTVHISLERFASTVRIPSNVVLASPLGTYSLSYERHGKARDAELIVHR
ncbi:MAG: tetratricopeptide repeat protein, partial [Planctomycetes bacterium]|nr:tetratricopeptide repeat protein [Planctomycetota bacterium]